MGTRLPRKPGTRIGWAVIVPTCLSIWPAAAPQGTPPVIKQIDHQLPMVWGRPGSSFTATTGIALGDVNLEFVPREGTSEARLTSLALQPVHFPTVCGDLTKRGLVLHEPLVCEEDPGQRRWTVVGFRHPFEGVNFFLIQYLAFDMDARRAAFRDTLEARRGGPFGFWRIREFRLAYPADQFGAAAISWQRLLGPPASMRPIRFVLEAGPSIVLTEGHQSNAATLVVEVESLERATTAARSLGLLQATSMDSLFLDPARLGGLYVVLVRR